MHDFSINFVNSASMVSNKNEIPSARSSPLLGSSHPLLRHTWREHPVSPPNEKKNEALDSRVGATNSLELTQRFFPTRPHHLVD